MTVSLLSPLRFTRETGFEDLAVVAFCIYQHINLCYSLLMKKAIIFDFDGVIADTGDILYALSLEFDPSLSEEDFKAHHDGNVYEEPRIKFTPEGAARLYDEYCNRLSVSHVK